MRAIWEILALKGPKLDQMAKVTLGCLEGQTRPLFHIFLDPECESYMKSPNQVLRGQYLAHNNQILGQNWSKRPNSNRIAQNGNQDHFSTVFPALSINLALKFQILSLEGQSWLILANTLAKNWSKRPRSSRISQRGKQDHFFHTVLSPECKSYMKSQNIVPKGHNFAHLDGPN